MHIVALNTYGREMRDRRSCIKCTQIVPDILLRLFGQSALDFTPSSSAYHFIYVPDVQQLYDGFLLLNLTDEEKHLVEEITRAYRGSPQTFLWQDGNWREFPSGGPIGHLDYRVATPSTCAVSYPRPLVGEPPALVPSLIDTPPTAKATSGKCVTIQRSDRGDVGKTWWWIGGDTKPVKDTLSLAGARWSRRRQQWYYIGKTLPDAIRALGTPDPSSTPPAETAPHGPLGDSIAVHNEGAVATSGNPTLGSANVSDQVGYTATTIRTTPVDSAVTEEGVMRSVQTDDVQAALIAHIHDWERGKPILIDFVGSRNAVKQLLAKPFNPSNIGRGDGVGFTIVNGSSFSNFRLPDLHYKAISASLKNRAVEGRIVSLDATTAAPRQECYVLVSEPIRFPEADDHDAITENWLHYVRYMQTPNRAEFAQYDPPAWAADLYNVYQALRVRLGRPLHVRWMPWLFQQVANQQLSSPKLGLSGVVVCKYIAGYIAPTAIGVVEQGAYRLTCSEASELWGEVILSNPNRAEGISFDSTEKGAAS